MTGVTSNASPIEVVYTAVMLIGLTTSIINYLYAHARLIELQRSGENGLVLILRKGARADQLKISGVFVCLMVIGLVSMSAPPNPNVTTGGIVSGLFFIGAGLMLTWKSITIRRRPAQLRAARK